MKIVPSGSSNTILRISKFHPGISEKYTFVEITAFPGRSSRAKRSLYQAIVHRLGPLGIPPNDILIIVVEPPMENWGIRGGHPASEVDLGYKTDV